MREFQKSLAGVRLSVSLFAAVVCVVVMTACSARPEGASADQTTSAPAAGEMRSKAADSVNKLDACALVPHSKVEELFGSPVQSANLGRSVEGTESTAAFSECTYQLSASQSISLFVRRSPVADNTPEATGRVRTTMKEVTGEEPVEVQGLGETAFWTGAGRQQLKQLHVFQGEGIYLYITLTNFKDEAQAKEKAIALARQGLATLQK